MPAFPLYDRIVVISDLHLPPSTRHGNLSDETGRRLVAWTDEQTGRGADRAALVIAGDFLDYLLVDSRPARLSLAAAARFTRTVLEDLARDRSWIHPWRTSLRAWLQEGGKLVVLTGNHDPELLHPDAAAVLEHWLDPPEPPSLEFWQQAGPWQAKVGRWDVMIGHGHRSDPDNDIDPQTVLEALHRGDDSLPLPLGSQLVLGPLARFKRAMKPDGTRRFPLLDALKPEVPSVLLLLFYLDPALVARNLPPALAPLLKILVRRLLRRLHGGPVLHSQSADRSAPAATTDGGASAADICEQVAEEMAAQLWETLSNDERQAPNGTSMRLEHYLSDGHDTAAPGTLAAHGGWRRKFLRAWLRGQRDHSAQFFDRSQPNAIDQRIIDQFLPPGCGPRVVIAGHTHAARHVTLPGERVYINTGTWTNLLDLSQFDDSDQAIRDLIDQLDAGNCPTFTRLSWAEIDADGPRLHEA